jgi:hypothetical protein
LKIKTQMAAPVVSNSSHLELTETAIKKDDLGKLDTFTV